MGLACGSRNTLSPGIPALLPGGGGPIACYGRPIVMGRGGGTRSGTPPGSPLVRSEQTLCQGWGQSASARASHPEGSKLGGGEGAPRRDNGGIEGVSWPSP